MESTLPEDTIADIREKFEEVKLLFENKKGFYFLLKTFYFDVFFFIVIDHFFMTNVFISSVRLHLSVFWDFLEKLNEGAVISSLFTVYKYVLPVALAVWKWKWKRTRFLDWYVADFI